MEPQRYSVLNQTRQVELKAVVTVVDTTREQLKGMLEQLAGGSDTALWLMPYRGMPLIPGLPAFDLLYLDEDYRVMQQVEGFQSSEFEPFEGDAASTLILPLQSISSSRTQVGDQLHIRIAEAPESVQPPQFSGTHRHTSPAAQPLAGIGAYPSLPQDRSLQVQSALLRLDQQEELPSQPDWKTRLLRWIYPHIDRRKAVRHALPGLVAFYWNGGAPCAYRIGDVSSTGFYLLTEERWMPGTMIMMTLQRTDTNGDGPEDAISAQSTVVRWGSDGVGFHFVLSDSAGHKAGDSASAYGASKHSMEHFLQQCQLPEQVAR